MASQGNAFLSTLALPLDRTAAYQRLSVDTDRQGPRDVVSLTHW